MVNAPRALSSSAVSRRQLLKGTGIGVATLAFGSALAACGDKNTPAAGTAGGGLVTMNYQLSWLKITQFAGYFVAEEKGYYKKEGLNANIAAGGPNISASQLVGAGRADLGDDDNVTLLQAVDKGLPLVMFATIFQKTPYSCISKSDRPIRTLQDMVGKTVAISAAGQAQLVPALKGAGVDASKVKIIPAGADPTQLVTGQVDGYFGYATDQGVSLQQKGLSLEMVSTSDLGFGSYGNILFTTKDNLANKKADLVKFLRATIMGYEYADQNPDEAAQLTVQKYGPAGMDLATQKLVAKAQASLIESPKGVMWFDPAVMQKIIDQQVAIKSISKSLKAADVMTTEVLEAAYGGKTSLL